MRSSEVVTDEKQRDGYLVHPLCSAEGGCLQGDTATGTGRAYGAGWMVCKHLDLYG